MATIRFYVSPLRESKAHGCWLNAADNYSLIVRVGTTERMKSNKLFKTPGDSISLPR